MRCNINNNSNFDISEIEDLLQDLFSFSQNRHGFKKPVTLNLMSDESNTSPLGKTAHYDPSTMEIVVYVDGRHPKDIMRSFSHELVHHNQNENGMFDNIAGESGDGYAQSNPHLRKMEKEAYLKGNMCFRDWEDGYKSSNPNILNERRIYKMSTKDWKNKELNGLLNERWGFSMDLNKLNEAGCGSHKRDDEKPLEEEEKCPKCEGKGCPHCDVKKEEKDGNKKTDKHDDNPKLKGKQKDLPDALQKAIIGSSDEKEINEISMGPGAKEKKSVPKDQLDQLKKQSDKNQSYMRKVMDKKPTNEEKEDFGPKTDMTKLSDEEKQKFLDAITIEELKAALKKKENKDPKEAKLREAIRRIIKKQLRK